MNPLPEPLNAILGGAPQAPRPFAQTSRYAGLATTTLTDAGGRTIVYLRRRFVPLPARFHTVKEHTVVRGDRLDNLAALYVGDPEQFWQLCDANGAIRPEELEEVGRRLRITLPADVPEAARD